MENIEYRTAYSEVLEILKHISKEDLNKIPKEMLEMFKANANKNYNFVYNTKKTLDRQHISNTAKTIIAILYEDYWKQSSSNLPALVPNNNLYNKFIILLKNFFNK